MMAGEATPSQMGALLMALRVRGETVEEITGAVTTMRDKMLRVERARRRHRRRRHRRRRLGLVQHFDLRRADRCRRRRSGRQARQPRSVVALGRSRRAGRLGVNIDLNPEQIGHCIREAGIGFMFAPAHHPAMKNVGATRAELGTRTIFNLLGPLSNPAGVRRQMVGVFSKHWTEPLAQVLKILGAESVWVVHGSDGLDEITTSGPTSVTALEAGMVRSFEISPRGCRPAEGQAGSAARRRRGRPMPRRLQDVLEGKKTPYRDVALFNAAAALVVAGKAKNLKAGLDLAAQSVDSGEAEGRLDRLIVVSNDG